MTMHHLSTLAAIQATGADARTFLQGQLSHDLNQLTTSHSLLASCNSAQGRVQSVLTLCERNTDILLLLPAVMVTQTLERLRKFVLRSKVTFTIMSDAQFYWTTTCATLTQRHWPIPTELGEHVMHAGYSLLRWRDPTERYLVIAPHTLDIESTGPDVDSDARWQLAEIRAGLPHILPSTYEAFVAQMLNLDLLQGISFNKGCYTGQEIIARTHYRGNIKRRMFRLSASIAAPDPGTPILSQGAHAGDVVMAAPTGTGCELLAVLNLTQLNTSLELATAPGQPLTVQTLPYAIPSA